MRVLRTRGLSVKVDFSFLLFNAVVFMMRDGGDVFAFYTACAVHEAGHIITAHLLGVAIKRVELSGFGMIMTAEKQPLMPITRSIAISAAGPAVNLLIFAVMSIAGRSGNFMTLNLAAAMYNLLPYDTLDGGAIISMLCEGRPNECVFRRCHTALKVGISVTLLILAAVWSREVLPLFVLSLILLLTDVKR